MANRHHPWKAPQTPNPKAARHGRPAGPGAPEISVEKLQRAFERSGLSKAQLARRLGWVKTVGNVHQVNEALGYKANSRGCIRKHVTYRAALRLVRAMGVTDYQELGI